mgnify:CR=1 FL=1
MWTIIKFDKKGLSFLQKDFKKKLGENLKFYRPKFFLHKYKNNKLVKKEFNLLGDYLFCYHNNFINTESLNDLKYCRGLKYFLNGFIKSQDEIEKFIYKCKKAEDSSGYLAKNFYELHVNSKYKFTTGPFTKMIFEIINLRKNEIDIFMGNIKTTIRKKDYLFYPA